jgi:hypothetical protein
MTQTCIIIQYAQRLSKQNIFFYYVLTYIYSTRFKY